MACQQESSNSGANIFVDDIDISTKADTYTYSSTISSADIGKLGMILSDLDQLTDDLELPTRTYFSQTGSEETLWNGADTTTSYINVMP